MRRRWSCPYMCNWCSLKPKCLKEMQQTLKWSLLGNNEKENISDFPVRKTIKNIKINSKWKYIFVKEESTLPIPVSVTTLCSSPPKINVINKGLGSLEENQYYVEDKCMNTPHCWNASGYNGLDLIPFEKYCLIYHQSIYIPIS